MEQEEFSLLHSKRVKGIITLVGLLLAVFLFAESIKSFKEYKFVGGGVPISNTITVSGEGEVFSIPDIATFTFSVTEEEETAEAAQVAATAKVNDALAFVREQGVEDNDIKTIGYNLSPRYEFSREICTREFCPPGGERQLVGFVVDQTVQVKLRDTEKSGDMVVGLSELAVERVNGPNFTIDDDDELRADARKAAIDDAKEKAKALASDLGVSLVRIVDFNEGHGGSPVSFRSFDMAMEESAFDDGAMAAPEIPTGENKIVSNVSITYEIR